MFRRMMQLAVEAAKVEVARWRNPGAEFEPAVEPVTAPTVAEPETPPAPAPKPASKWATTQQHIEALASAECPDCGERKRVGSYRCGPCYAKAVAS